MQKMGRQLFTQFLFQLMTFQQFNPIPKSQGLKYVSLLGENSAGKSSLFNYALGTNQKTGVDDTTQEVKILKVEHNKLRFFDTPGLNENIDITNADRLKSLYSLDRVFIVTGVTFKNCHKVISVVNKINPPQWFLVRNHCDKFTSEQEFHQAASKDYLKIDNGKYFKCNFNDFAIFIYFKIYII